VVIALGFWGAALGYALIYTGVQFFTGGNGSLASNLGLSTTLTAAGSTAPPLPRPQGGQAPASGSLTGAATPAGTGGPSGSGYPSSTYV
jgi:hypothetical protein